MRLAAGLRTCWGGDIALPRPRSRYKVEGKKEGRDGVGGDEREKEGKEGKGGERKGYGQVLR